MTGTEARSHSPWGSIGRSPWTWVLLAIAAMATVAFVALGPMRTTLDRTFAGPPHGPYRYTRSTGAALLGGAGRYQVLVPYTREIWIASDGSGRLHQINEDAVFFGTYDRAEWSGIPTAAVRDDHFKAGGLSCVDFAGTPVDPEDLRDKLIAGAVPVDDRPSAIFAEVADLLRETVAPQPVAAAADVVLATTTGIAQRVDETGNNVYTVRSANVERSLTLDSQTHQLVAEKKTLLAEEPSIDADPPVVIEYVTYLDSREVEHL